MSIVIDITDTFPTHDILALCRVKLHSLVIITGVMLKIDDSSGKYFVEFPSLNDEQRVVKLCDASLKEKVFDSIVFKYEESVNLMCQKKELVNKPSYIYQLEKERIERKSVYKQQPCFV